MIAKLQHSRTNALQVRDELAGSNVITLLDLLVDQYGRPFEPTDIQVPLLNDRTRFQVWLMGRRCGKSTTAAVRAIIEMMKPYKRVWIVAPYYELTEKIYRVVHNYVTRCLPFMLASKPKYSKNGMSMRFVNGSELVCKTAEKEDQLIGESLDLVIVDEAGVVKDTAIEYILPGLNDINPYTGLPKGSLIAVSTPRSHNWFYKWWELGLIPPEEQLEMFNGRIVHASHHASSFTNPHIDHASIEMDRKRLPEMLWAQEYLAQWQTSGGLVFPVRDAQFFPVDFRTPKIGQSTYMGIDLGRTMDFTVITAFNSKLEMLGYRRLNKTDWAAIKSVIRNEIEKYSANGPVTVCIDATGVGDPIYEDLKRYFSMNEFVHLVPINFSRDQKVKKEIIETLRMYLSDNLIKFCNIKDIRKEFIEYEYTMDSKGNPVYGHPKGEDKHDDIVTSIGLAVYATTAGVPSVSVAKVG